MANPLLKYLDNQRWINGVDKTRADSQLEFIDTVSSSVAGTNGGAVAPGIVRVSRSQKSGDAPVEKALTSVPAK
jgi:L-aminopeptidase/D-esterase-like protein